MYILKKYIYLHSQTFPMKKITLFGVLFFTITLLTFCTKDQLPLQEKEEEVTPIPEDNDNEDPPTSDVRLSTRVVVTNGNTNNYSYVYENDRLKQIIHTGNNSVDTSFYYYTDTTVTNFHKNLAEQTTLYDTLYVSDNKILKVSGKNHNSSNNVTRKTVEEYSYTEHFIDKYIRKSFTTSIAPSQYASYSTDDIEANSLIFVLTSGVGVTSTTRYKVFFDSNNKVDSIINYRGLDLNAFTKKLIYIYSSNQITIHTYNASNTLINTDIVTLDNSINKITKVERFDAGNTKYYEETRIYIAGNSNHELILYKHPLRNEVVLLGSYY